jgi:hypothetical protein
LNQRLEVEGFLSSYAVLLSNDLTLKKKFIYRVYENSSGVLERERIEAILSLVYGELQQKQFSKIHQVLDSLFRDKKREVSKTKFEQWQGKTEILSDWVVRVLSVFIEPLPPKLFALQKKYSSAMEAETLINRFNISIELYHSLVHQFYSHCKTSFKPELYLSQWISWVSQEFLNPYLAKVIFSAATESFKPVWRFMDFAEFSCIYGAGTVEARANAVTTAFIKYAILERSNYFSSSSAFSSAAAALKCSNSPAMNLSKSFSSTVRGVQAEEEFEEEEREKEKVKEKEKENGLSPPSLLLINSLNPDFDSWLSEVLTAMVYHLLQPLEITPSPEDFSSPVPTRIGTMKKSEDNEDDENEDGEERLMSTITPGGGDNEEGEERSAMTPSRNQSHSNKKKRRRSYSLNISALPLSRGSVTHSIHSKSTPQGVEPLGKLSAKQIASVPKTIIESLQAIYNDPKQSADSFVNLLVSQEKLLNGFRDLSITASCLFGVQPTSAGK